MQILTASLYFLPHGYLLHQNSHQPFSLIMSTRGGNKMIDGAFIYGQQRRAGEVIHWQCEQGGI